LFVNENSLDWSASRTHSKCTLADRNDWLDEVDDGCIGFICDTGIAGADVNFNLEVFGRVDDALAVDVGVIEFGGVGIDGAVFVSPVNDDMVKIWLTSR